MKKRMPYGMANFEEIATGPYYYIDKTQYIEKLEQVKFPVFIRPRRFGKSLLTEMLRWYYDIKAKDRFDEIFGNLYIGKNPTGNQNKYYFLSLNFSGIDTTYQSQEKLKEQFDSSVVGSIVGFLMRYSDLLHFDDNKINDFQNKFNNNSVGAFKQIIELINSQGRKLYLTIDEYASLTNALAIRYRYTNADDNLYLNILQKGGFFRTFFEAIKAGTQTAIVQVYITGILPITISDMNSGFNIATWITFDSRFTNMLGITTDEFDNFIDLIYSDYNITLNKGDVKSTIKRYYNGYRFLTAETEVYNPMMTLYFLNYLIYNNNYPPDLTDRNIKVDYNQISFLFGQNTEQANQIITKLTDNKEYTYYNTLDISFDMTDYKEGKHIAEGLYYLGITTFSEKNNTLKIPNLITYDFAVNYFKEINKFSPQNYDIGKWFGKYLIDGNIEALFEGFFRELIQAFPGDFFANVNESFYHGLFFNLLFNNTRRNAYEVLPEFNLTNGQVDIMLRSYPNAHVQKHLKNLFELKRVPKKASETEFEKQFQEGVEQMKSYLIGEYADWQGVVVCFRGNLDYKIMIINETKL